MAKVAFLTLHGMGDTPKDFARKMLTKLEATLGPDWSEVKADTVFYQTNLQENQVDLWKRYKADEIAGKIKLDHEYLRREIFLYAFADASSMENDREQEHSAYQVIQTVIAQKLMEIHNEQGNVPVVIHAQSLGCQVISNYIWDAQQDKPSCGYWKYLYPTIESNLSQEQKDVLRLKNLRKIVTTGCNIPLFVSGHSVIKAIDRSQLGDKFEWINLYDKDDILGWPLTPLSDAYRDLVTDRQINSSGGISGKVLASTPLCHSHYWTDNDVINTIADTLTLLAHEC